MTIHEAEQIELRYVGTEIARLAVAYIEALERISLFGRLVAEGERIKAQSELAKRAERAG